jgi:hypothetical protein
MSTGLVTVIYCQKLPHSRSLLEDNCLGMDVKMIPEFL